MKQVSEQKPAIEQFTTSFFEHHWHSPDFVCGLFGLNIFIKLTYFKQYVTILVNLPQNIWWNLWFTLVFIGILHFHRDAFQITWVFWFFNLWHSLVQFFKIIFFTFRLALASFWVWWWFWCFSGWMKFEKIISKFEPDCDWVSPFLNLFELREEEVEERRKKILEEGAHLTRPQ